MEQLTMRDIILKNKKAIVGKTVTNKRVSHPYTITGIGPKAIKFRKGDSKEDEFVFYNRAHMLMTMIIKSFDNELYNEHTKAEDKKQEQYCIEHNLPKFAPQDGLCLCNTNIYNKTNGDGHHITGCPNCHRSFCD